MALPFLFHRLSFVIFNRLPPVLFQRVGEALLYRKKRPGPPVPPPVAMQTTASQRFLTVATISFMTLTSGTGMQVSGLRAWTWQTAPARLADADGLAGDLLGRNGLIIGHRRRMDAPGVGRGAHVRGLDQPFAARRGDDKAEQDRMSAGQDGGCVHVGDGDEELGDHVGHARFGDRRGDRAGPRAAAFPRITANKSK